MKYREEELLKKYTSPEFLEKFEKLFCIHILFDKGLFNENFEVDEKLATAISLTETGQEYYDAIKPEPDEEHIVKFFLFIQFYFEELYIDVVNTDLKVLENFLDKSIKSKAILYPWIYRKDLYDSFFEKFNENTDVLNAKMTKKLLEGSLTGVFQIGEYITGSFGLLKGESKRLVMPTKNVPLYHCTDPACKTLHKAQLNDIATPFHKIARRMSRFIPQKEPSEWLDFFVALINKDSYYDVTQLNNLQKFIINSFDDTEITTLFTYLCDKNGLRKKFPNNKKYKGSISDIVQKIDISEVYQFILSKSSVEIIIAIEHLIKNDLIKIPVTEVRKSPIKYSSGAYRVYHECNQFGIRATSSMQDFAILTLKKVLSKLYSSEEPQKQLKWVLRHKSGDTLDEKIYNLLQTSNPETVVNELVFNNPSNIENLSSILPGCFDLPLTQEDETLLKNRILWKLGFNPKIFPLNHSYIWNAYSALNTLIDSIDNVGNKIDEVRAVSSNLFVALEKFLDTSLSFITWTLLSDHFAATKFKFNLIEARKFMAGQLNKLEYGGEEVNFDSNGKNTLFPLTVGFSLLGNLCESLIEKKSDFKRSYGELPSFAKNESLFSFPFEHKKLFLDLKAKLQSNVVIELQNITHSIEKSNIMGIRNKLQHNRDSYPDKSELAESLSYLSSVIKNIEALGYHPNSYWKSRLVIDEYNRVSAVYVDSNNANLNLELAPEYKGCGLTLNESIVIIPSIQIGETNENIRFEVVENSNFKHMWENYPKKRKSIKKKDVEQITPSP